MKVNVYNLKYIQVILVVIKILIISVLGTNINT